MGAVLERYRDGMGKVWHEIGAAVWDSWVWYMGAAQWDRYGMIGFGIRERYGSSIGAAVWNLV